MATEPLTDCVAGKFATLTEPWTGNGVLTTCTAAATAVIIGAGDTGERVLRYLKYGGKASRRIVGFLDDDPQKFGSQLHGFRVLGTRAHLEGLLEQRGVQEVLVAIADPPGVRTVHVDSADQMLAACLAAGTLDVAVCAAAVADWKMAKPSGAKIKKKPGVQPPALDLVPNPDILATLSKPGKSRPALIVGFAAETENLVANAIDKRQRKGCDWIVANDVSPATGTMGGDRNTVHLITREGAEVRVDSWPAMTKAEVATALVARIAEFIETAA